MIEKVFFTMLAICVLGASLLIPAVIFELMHLVWIANLFGYTGLTLLLGGFLCLPFLIVAAIISIWIN